MSSELPASIEAPWTCDIKERARAVRLVALDVDGVLTDGSLRYTAAPHLDGDKVFNVRDGLGLRLLIDQGIEVALITGRRSPAVDRRARELGIAHVIQGRDDKRVALEELLGMRGFGHHQALYCGDDLPDLGAIMAAGIGVTVADAPEVIRARADYVTRAPGGRGAVRELCEHLLVATGAWHALIARFEKS